MISYILPLSAKMPQFSMGTQRNSVLVLSSSKIIIVFWRMGLVVEQNLTSQPFPIASLLNLPQ
jgi:hypothetical protein